MANKVYKSAKYIKDNSKNCSEYDFIISFAPSHLSGIVVEIYPIRVPCIQLILLLFGLCRGEKPKNLMTDRESLCGQFAFFGNFKKADELRGCRVVLCCR
jgi:hypothetical protein